jgi:hypothetical protein
MKEERKTGMTEDVPTALRGVDALTAREEQKANQGDRKAENAEEAEEVKDLSVEGLLGVIANGVEEKGANLPFLCQK